MKVSIKGKPAQFTLVTIISEEVELPPDKAKLFGKNKEIKAVAYVFDKERIAHRFLAEDIERYD